MDNIFYSNLKVTKRLQISVAPPYFPFSFPTHFFSWLFPQLAIYQKVEPSLPQDFPFRRFSWTEEGAIASHLKLESNYLTQERLFISRFFPRKKAAESKIIRKNYWVLELCLDKGKCNKQKCFLTEPLSVPLSQ